MQIEACRSLDAALERLAARTPDAVLLDLSSRGSEGLTELRTLREECKGAAIVVLTDRENDALGVGALAAGAQDHLQRSRLDSELLPRATRYACERARIEAELERRSMYDGADRAAEPQPVRGSPPRRDRPQLTQRAAPSPSSSPTSIASS